MKNNYLNEDISSSLYSYQRGLKDGKKIARKNFLQWMRRVKRQWERDERKKEEMLRCLLLPTDANGNGNGSSSAVLNTLGKRITAEQLDEIFGTVRKEKKRREQMRERTRMWRMEKKSGKITTDKRSALPALTAEEKREEEETLELLRRAEAMTKGEEEGEKNEE